MKWYFERLKTMTIRELIYRVSQQFNYQYYRKEKGRLIKPTSYDHEREQVLENDILLQYLGNTIQIFEKELDFSVIPNWHLDLSSGKEFPKKYSFDIDIRTDKYGSAKYVWEVNRMLFLPRVAINFKQSEEYEHLVLFMNHIKSWKAHNPYLVGVNWYSNIEINIRLINWAFSWEILNGSQLVKTNPKFKEFVEDEWIPLIYQHCIYSASLPSLYSSANNHLVAEHTGLFLANCIWKFPESKEWLIKAQLGLETEIVKQHSPEGINKEEAAEYIQFITDFFLLSFVFGEKSNHPFSTNFKNKLIQIFDYILGFLDVDGNFPQYGDEDDGRVTLLNKELHASNFDSILISAAIITANSKYKLPRLKIGNKNLILFGIEGNKFFESLQTKRVVNSNFFPKSGHFIFRKVEDEKEIYLHFDVATLGYLSIAAHGHADALSVILHIDGKPILIDSGTYTYHTHPEWRYYFISTIAHNTVCINNQNQALNGGALMWTKHFNSQVIGYSDKNADVEWVVGEHDGYKQYGHTHKRKVTFNKLEDIFIIEDTISTTKPSNILINIPWHLHPNCNVIIEGNNYIVEREDTRKVIIHLDEKLSSEIVIGCVTPIMGWYSESFYKKQPTHTIMSSININIVKEVTFITTIEIV